MMYLDLALLLSLTVGSNAAPAGISTGTNGTSAAGASTMLGTGLPLLTGAIPTSIQRPSFLLPNGTGASIPTGSAVLPSGSFLLTGKGSPTGTGSKPSGTASATAKSSSNPQLSNNVRFNATGPWTTNTCTANITNESVPGPQRWQAADASDALDQLFAAYNAPLPSGDIALSFPQYAFNAFFENPGANCGDASDPVCGNTVVCDPNNNGMPAAAPMILNSLVTIHNMIQEANGALDAAQKNIGGSAVNFAGTFAKMPATHNFFVFTEILDALAFVLGAGVGCVLESMIAAAEVSATQLILKQVKNVATAGVSYGITSSKDATAKPGNTYEEAQDLESLLQAFYSQYVTTQAGFLEGIMAGNTSTSQSQLKSLIDNGLMLSIQQSEQSNVFSQLQATSTQLLYGKLIPAAWQISQNHQNPFLLRVDRSQYTCGDKVANSGKFQLDQYMSDDTASKTSWCDGEGNSWFLLNAESNNDGEGISASFGVLDGGDSVTLSNYSVALSDIVKSTYGGFIINGNKNGYQLSPNSSLAVSDDFNITDGVLPFIGGLTTPGFFNFTLCLSSSEAASGIVAGNLSAPCPISPNEDLVSPNINTAGYAPGWCGVHVDYYQKNEGNTNPTNNYQLAVTIKDAANQVVGLANKQDAAMALVVQSELPFNLIVEAGKTDSDPLNFWYADQWWTSDSQQNHCNLGKFNGGQAQGDCGFTCGNLTSTPPASATVALPNALTTANSASHTPTGTGTATTTATTTSTKAGTYATGWCGVHVRQWQKNEAQVNPNPEYAVEITLYDAKQNLIFDSGEKNTPDNVPVSAQGPLPSPLNVTVTSPDNSPVTFSYAGQHWAYADAGHHCNFGKFDSGHRDGDCGFTC